MRDLQAAAMASKTVMERQAEDPLWTWVPTPPQTAFLEWKGSECWFIGANRTGKSDVAAAGGSSLARNGNLDPRPSYCAGGDIVVYDRAAAIWIVSLTFAQSREVMQPKMFDNGEVPPGQPHPPFIPNYELLHGDPSKAYNKTEHVLKLKNGSFIGFKAAEQGQLALQGSAKDLIVFDEAPPKIVYNECVARVEAGRKLYIRGACTLLPPNGVTGGISWLYTDKIKPWLAGVRPSFLHLQKASIYDNPHIPKEEIERLEAMYPPGSIDREIRLNGAWLPQIMGQLAYSGFRSGIHVNPMLGRKDIAFRHPLLLCFDSNVTPCSAVIAQQHGRIYRALDEVVVSTGGIPALGREFRRRYPLHGAELLIYGDAMGLKRSAQTTKSDYDILCAELEGLPYPYSLMLPTINPPERERINATNFLFRGPGGEVRFECSPDCKELIEDYETVQLNKFGGILKSHDLADPYYQRTHTSDAFGYMIVQREPVGSVEAIQQRGDSAFPLSIPSPAYRW